MIGQASEQKPDRLFYRTLFGTKELPRAVIDIEFLEFIIPTLPNPLQEVAKGMQDIFLKSLTFWESKTYLLQPIQIVPSTI